MAKLVLKKEVLAFVEKGKYPKRKGGKMTLSSDAGTIIVNRVEDSILRYSFVEQGRQVMVNLSEGGEKPIMKESAIPAEVSEQLVPADVPKAAPAKGKEKPEPQMVEQKDEKGQPEQVDFNLYSNVIQCADCGEVRYVKNADRHQVVRCKPCARRFRRKAIRARKKERGKANKFIEGKAAEKAAAKK